MVIGNPDVDTLKRRIRFLEHEIELRKLDETALVSRIERLERDIVLLKQQIRTMSRGYSRPD